MFFAYESMREAGEVVVVAVVCVCGGGGGWERGGLYLRSGVLQGHLGLL
jgi:hypothetical protein